ncbi:MAG: exopolysaccharide biosynthesis protein [Methylophilaceae bacterium]|nr:exopolysaccharide biosynthesis protein [Methylophilaceae bacterium]
MSNHRALIQKLHGIAKKAERQSVSIEDGLSTLNHFGFSFISFLLALPFMQPFPVGPISVLGGVTFAAFGWQILKGYTTPHLPQKINHIILSADNWRRITNAAIKIIQWTEKFTRPRLPILIQGRLGIQIEAFILIVSGLLMAVPFGILPLNNFFPGLAIVFCALGQLQHSFGFFLLFFILLHFL